MTDRIGQHVRIVLVGDRYYSGKIISEDDLMIIILDKFGKEVSLGKSSIISLRIRQGEGMLNTIKQF